MFQFVHLHQWIVTFAYPFVNVLLLIAYIYGVRRTTFRAPFAFLVFAAGLLLFSQLVSLVLKVEEGFGFIFVSRDAFRSIWPFAALAEYLSFVCHLVGAILLVRGVFAISPRVPTV